MRPPELRDSIVAYARAARDAGAADLCSGVWPGDAPEFVQAALRAQPRAEADYPPPQGTASLRKAVAASYPGGCLSAGNVTVAPGATGALLIALSALAPRRSEVIVIEPGYPLSGYVVEALGLQVRQVAARVPPSPAGGWNVDVEKICAAIDDRVSAVIVTDPDNPTGAVLGENDWKRLIGAARSAGCCLIVDRVYEHYPLDAMPVPTSALVAEGVIVVASVSKWLHAAGLRIGWVLSPAGFADALAQTSALLFGGVAAPLQAAVANGIDSMPSDYLVKEAAAARRSRRTLVAALAARGIETWPADGGLFLNVPATSMKAADSYGAWRALLETGIGGVPSSVFRASAEEADEAFVRLCFAREPNTLRRPEHPRPRPKISGGEIPAAKTRDRSLA
jgi:N-succinyldiaminopimelate aminotransferase